MTSVLFSPPLPPHPMNLSPPVTLTFSSTATLCALDVAKTFDKTNHFGLYVKLMDRHIPLPFLNALIKWYSKCFGVRWGSFVSSTFQIFADVRQGGVLSPHFMLFLLILLLVNYELQVLVLALATFSSVVCFMLTIYCVICKLCLISVRRKL